MLDQRLRHHKDRLLEWLVSSPIGGLRPWLLTLTGVVVGVGAACLVAGQQYGWGLGLWLFNRLCDGLDGAVARQQARQSDLGGYLDMMADVLVYALIPCGLVWSQDQGWWSLAALLASFYINLCSWTYLAAILEKRQQHPSTLTTITMPGGLIEGTETMLFYCVFLLLPQYCPLLLAVMAILVLCTASQRVIWACQHL
ncbi:MAG: CDP-alcohol phosphatidyltransferase family protein [Thermostichales cyanobacterium SRBZ-1_bins_19]